MNFEKQVKTLKVYGSFNKLMLEDKLSQAYLFVCPDEFTNKILTSQIAKLLVCKNKSACDVCPHCVKVEASSHPDVLVFPKEKNFAVEDAGQIYDNIQIKPMLADLKVIIINNMDTATIQAQNKMLKIIEEPPKNVVFLLSCTNEDKVLSTILSRVQKMQVDRLDQSVLKDILQNVDDEVKAISLCFGDGYLGKTLEISQNATFLENYKNMLELVLNLKRSDQIPEFSKLLNKDKETFAGCLQILCSLLRDVLMTSLNKHNLVSSKNLQVELQQLASEYSALSLNNILKLLNEYKKRFDANVNLTVLADNLLFDILEVKFLCK
ncbi:MAG: hypothetical protein E7378_02515 [Clostridiales bacterium]|nr:hypothetical protein [Clostridiales bacterium]